ncbi:MAG: hypothetical protein ACTSUE_26890 [Promethearchaeota archaeon]
MDAIILAAGEGKRFFSGKIEARPLPFDLQYPVPKSLFPVKVKSKSKVAGNKPMLGTLIDALFEGGIEHVFIGTGHLAGKIKTYISHAYPDKKVQVVEPNPRIDFRKGPLFTLATVLQHLSSTGILTQKNQDKIFMIVPADLVIDRKAIWYITGPASRGMMSSRSTFHVMVDNRPGGMEEKKGAQFSPLRTIIPDSFTHLFDGGILDCPLVPIVSIHVEILLDAVPFLNQGMTKLSPFIKRWLNDHYQTDREFRVNVNVITANYLGESFTWCDVDTWEDLVNAGL